MNRPGYGGATHLSIVWAVTLAIVTLMEWRQLDQDPINRDILSPFIERQVSIQGGRGKQRVDEFEQGLESGGRATGEPAYIVEFHFNGPLFLLCFFGPVAVFHGVAHLLSRFRNP